VSFVSTKLGQFKYFDQQLGRPRLEREKKSSTLGETGETCSEIRALPSITTSTGASTSPVMQSRRAKKLFQTHTGSFMTGTTFSLIRGDQALNPPGTGRRI